MSIQPHNSKSWAVPAALLIGLALTACGGGGGDSAAVAQPLPKLADTATLSYSEPDYNSYMHDPWTRVRMVPKLNGLPAGSTATYSAKTALATGLSLDTSTGVVTGLPEFGGEVKIAVTAKGYDGEVVSTYPFGVSTVHPRLASASGVEALEAFKFKGKVGALITFSQPAGLIEQWPGPPAYTLTGEPLPAGVVSTYYFIGEKPAAAGINSETGEVIWAPQTSGEYVLQWGADLTKNGITRKYESSKHYITVTQ
jgi:hypothetical protein